MRSAMCVHSFNRSTRSARLSVVTSKVAKCIRSCASVMMPAWRSPRNGTGACRCTCESLAADARPASAPAPAAPATATPTPAAPRSLRREKAEVGVTEAVDSLRGDDTLHLADFLAQCVDGAGQLLALRFGDCVVEHETVTLAVLHQQGLDLAEALVDTLAQVGVALVEDGPHRGDRGLRPLHVGVEVPQIGVAEDVLLAADLAG